MTERLTGIDRTGDPLLSPDEAVVPFIRLLLSSQWYANYLYGMANAPIGVRWQKRRRSPQPGELCYVTDHAGNPRSDDDTIRKAFGYFLGEQQEPIYSEEVWQEVRGQYYGRQDCPTEDVFYIQYGPKPGDVCRWENASCQAIATRAISDELHDRF